MSGSRPSGKPGLRIEATRRAALIALAIGAGAALASPTAAKTGPPKPKVPPGRHPGGIAVAVIGAGVDYRRRDFAQRLARDGEGEMIGWDVIDDDPFPLEAAPAAGRQVPAHAGSESVGLLLAEAGATSLIPVRVPEANTLALGAALTFVSRTPARVAIVLAGGAPDDAWGLFAGAARAGRNLIVIAPSTLALGDAVPTPSNLLVVTASDEAGGPIAGHSSGRTSAAFAIPVPGQLIPAAGAEHRGTAIENAAALRAGALAARLAAVATALDGAALKARILSHGAERPSGTAASAPPLWIARANRLYWPE